MSFAPDPSDPAIDGDCAVACELAVAREFPICRHEALVAGGGDGAEDGG